MTASKAAVTDAEAGAELVASKPTAGGQAISDDERRFRELRGALDNLSREVTAAAGPRNQLGLKVNVALRVAATTLKRYPAPTE